MNTERIRIWIGFLIVTFVWGSTWLAIKIGLQSVPPLIAVGLRFFIASLILYLIIRIRKVPILLTPEAKKLYVTLIILSYSVPFGIVYWGQQFIPSGLSSILFGAYPFSVAIFSHFLLPSERLNALKIVGIAFCFTGLVVIFSQDVHWNDSHGLLGMLAVLANAIIQGLALVLVKKYGQPISPFAMNFVGMFFAGLLLLAVGLATESFGSIIWDAAAIGSILYLAIVGSVLAFVTYFWLLKRIEAVYLSLVSFINPIIAVILGAIILHEVLATSVYVGAGFVLIGILVANGRYLYQKVRGAE